MDNLDYILQLKARKEWDERSIQYAWSLLEAYLKARDSD